MRRLTSIDWSGEAGALAMGAAALLMASLMAWALALGHMAEIGAICGQATAHCVWCGVGSALGIAGLAMLAAALATVSGEEPGRGRPPLPKA